MDSSEILPLEGLKALGGGSLNDPVLILFIAVLLLYLDGLIPTLLPLLMVLPLPKVLPPVLIR